MPTSNIIFDELNEVNDELYRDLLRDCMVYGSGIARSNPSLFLSEMGIEPGNVVKFFSLDKKKEEKLSPYQKWERSIAKTS